MARQPLDPYLLPALRLFIDGQPRSAGRYRQQLFQRIQTNLSLRRESWTTADHPQFLQMSMLVAAALVKAGMLDASSQGELTITPHASNLLRTTHLRMLTMEDLLRAGQPRAVPAGRSSRAVSSTPSGWGVDWFQIDIPLIDNVGGLLDLSLQGISALAEGFDWS